MTKTYEQTVNATCRNWSPNKSPLLKVICEELEGFTGTILEFGAGRFNQNVEYLNNQGFRCVGCDIGDNVRPDHVAPQPNQFKVIFANRVLNVQPDFASLEAVLQLIYSFLQTDGVFYFNIPKDPCPLGQKEVERFVRSYFDKIESFGTGSKRYHVVTK